jgi:hypothetical protein
MKDPKSPEEFLKNAQRVEELKSLDDRQNDPAPTEVNENQLRSFSNKNNHTNNNRQNQSFTINPPSNQNNNYQKTNFDEVPVVQSNNKGYNNGAGPRPPYRCYNCNGTDHLYRNCPYFQEGSH